VVKAEELIRVAELEAGTKFAPPSTTFVGYQTAVSSKQPEPSAPLISDKLETLAFEGIERSR